ncbi:MAG: sortase [Clostridia bacterium]|nr:sortase [Clostridia bacterium]
MFESKYNKLLTVILVIVVIGIIGLIGFLVFQFVQNNNNTQEAETFVNNYEGDIGSSDDNEDLNSKLPEENTTPTNSSIGDLTVNSSSSSSNTVRTKKQTYNGFIVNGTMEIPKINFKYPVLDKVSKSSIENSVAILYGAGLNQVGNTVIIGHNYRNGQFFSNLKKVTNGDKIYITDYEGKKKTYTVYHHFVTTPDDTSFYQRDTNGKAEITLSTCTDDSSGRTIVFAKED